MTRHEFMRLLRESLTGEIPDSAIEENMRFYNRYVDDEMNKGRREADIFAELGDPRLIARTIMETWQSDDTSLDDDGYSSSQDDGYGYRQEDDPGYGSFVNVNGRHLKLDKWYMKLIPIAVMILVVCFVFWVLFGLLHLTFAVLTSPVFWVILAVLMVLGYFSQRR